jgi:hypothetical protein
MSKPIQSHEIFHNAIYEEIEKISPSTAKLASDEIAKIANLLVKYGFLQYPEDEEFRRSLWKQGSL